MIRYDDTWIMHDGKVSPISGWTYDMKEGSTGPEFCSAERLDHFFRKKTQFVVRGKRPNLLHVYVMEHGGKYRAHFCGRHTA